MESVAEIIMAGADDRGTVFPNALPFGAFNRHKALPLPGKLEIGSDNKQTYLDNFHRQMIDEFAISSGTIEPGLIDDAADQLEHCHWRKKAVSKGNITVKALPCNPWGLYQMHGNVQEWCEDNWGDYPNVAQSDPTGTDSGTARVLRLVPMAVCFFMSDEKTVLASSLANWG